MSWNFLWGWLIWPAIVAAAAGGGGIMYARWLSRQSDQLPGRSGR